MQLMLKQKVMGMDSNDNSYNKKSGGDTQNLIIQSALPITCLKKTKMYNQKSDLH